MATVNMTLQVENVGHWLSCSEFAAVFNSIGVAVKQFIIVDQSANVSLLYDMPQDKYDGFVEFLASEHFEHLVRAGGGDQSSIKIYSEAEPPALAAPKPKAQEKRVCLNLGCGNVLLRGYINVDVVDQRLGFQPDVTCDVRNLSVFEDNYADEILAVHVVEHFWRWEIEAVLREWVRVLKPGGKMVLECPNLLSACEEFLKNPEMAAKTGSTASRTMWVLYGDPKHEDPLMCHRWGYTPQSLGELLESVGLTDVKQEPAKYKLREPRDMRVTGVKAGAILS